MHAVVYTLSILTSMQKASSVFDILATYDLSMLVFSGIHQAYNQAFQQCIHQEGTAQQFYQVHLLASQQPHQTGTIFWTNL